MASPSTIRPLLLSHALPHIPAHGFSLAALSRASLTLPPPYHYSQPLTPPGIETLFGQQREPERALVREWLESKRAQLAEQDKAARAAKGDGSSSPTQSLAEVLEARLSMNEPVRAHLADAFALFSLTSTKLPIINTGLKTPFPVLNHSLHIADQALRLSSPSRPDLHQSLPLSLVYLSAELHQLSLPLDAPSMPSTSAFLRRRLDEYHSFQGQVDGAAHLATTAWNALNGAVRSRF